MADITVYNFPVKYRMTTFPARACSFFNSLNAPIDLRQATIVMEFRQEKKTGALLKRLVPGAGFTINGDDHNVLTLDAFVLDFPVGKAYFDCMITINGIREVYFEGSQPIIQNTTQP